MEEQNIQDKDHDRFLGMIEKQFLGKLGAEQSEELAAHVRECAPCERAYERWAGAEQALFAGKGAGELNPLQQSRVADRLFRVEPKAPSRQRIWMGSGTLVAALSAVLLFVSIRTDDGFQARSGGAKLSEAVTFRTLRVRKGGTQSPLVVDLASSPDGLQQGDRLRFVYSNLGEYRFLRVVAASDGGKIIPLVASTAIQTGAEDQNIGQTIRVGSEWPAGPVRFLALFSREPASETIVKREPYDAPGRALRIVGSHVLH